MDLPLRASWYDYFRGRDRLLDATGPKHAPRYLVRSDNKNLARLNSISHLLSLIPYK